MEGLRDEAPAAPAQVVAEEQPFGAGPGRKLRVLLAEDNALNRRLTAALLERPGAQPRPTSWMAARRWRGRALGGNFDAVLMDIQMPEMDGLTATRLIREQAEAAAGDARVPDHRRDRGRRWLENRELCLEAGMDECFCESKPIDPTLFRETLAAAGAGLGAAGAALYYLAPGENSGLFRAAEPLPPALRNPWAR